MNSGTIIRGVGLVIILLNQANAGLGPVEFSSPIAQTIYEIISYLLTLAAAVVVYYFNNDLTPEAALGTGVTRQLKAEKGANYVGDVFFVEDEDFVADEDEDEPDGDGYMEEVEENEQESL